MKTRYTHIKNFLTLALFVFAFVSSKSQTNTDGAMYLEYYTSYYWVGSVDDFTTGELNDNEFRWIFWGADNANLDGQGWRGGATIGINSGGYGWVGGGFNLLMSQQYGAAGSTAQNVPTYLQLRGEGWEDDCFDCYRSTGTFSWSCDQCSSYIYDGGCGCSTNVLCGCSAEDQHCGPQDIDYAIPFRVVPPCSQLLAGNGPAWIGDRYTSGCGSSENDNVGAELQVYWTPPRPTMTATATSLCAGGGNVTLNLSGVVFGGTYAIYDESTASYLTTTYTGSNYTLFVGSTKTLRLYTRNNSCQSQSWFPLTITVAGALNGGSVASAQTVCYGGDPAAFTNTASASGGVGGFTYQWESQTNCAGGFGDIIGATSSTYNIPAGITQTTCYRRKAINYCGNAYSNTLTVTVLPQINYGTVTGGGGTYCGTADPGIMSVTPSGGTGSFGYQWYYQNGTVSCPSGTNTSGWTPIGGANSPSYDPPSGLTQTRTYAVQVDPTGSPDCSGGTWASNCVTVTVTPVATANAGGPDVACQSGVPSAITLSGASVGGSATTGAWSISSGGGSLSNTSQTATPATVTYTPAPNYVGSVTLQLLTNDPDGAGPCPAVSATRTITVNQAATVTAGGPDGVCQSATPSAITLSGSSFGGSASTAAWSIVTGGGSLSNTSQTATPSSVTYTPAANFNGTVTLQLTSNDPDGAGPCAVATATRTIAVHALPSAVPTSNSPVCVNDQINLNANASGGLPAYTYSWSGPLGFSSSSGSPSLSNATLTMAGTYAVTVTDQNTCSNTASTSVSVNPLPNGNISGTNTICSGSSSVITFHFSVGTGPFNISFTDGTNIFSKNGVSDGDTAQVAPPSTLTYTYAQITDANGCTRGSGFLGGATVTVAPQPAITNVSVTDVLCYGGSTGTISVTATGGTPSYQYSIDNGATFQTSSTFTALAAGPYSIVVSDALSCATAYGFNPVTIAQPTQLDHSTATTDASCANVFDGSIVVTATGGVPPYNYSLNGGPSQNGNSFLGLSGGTYVVQVNDDNGCSDTSHVLINNSYGVIGSIVTQTDVSCFGGSDGTVTVQLTGGIPPYSYSINGLQFQPSPTFTGLSAGNYVATLRDTKGCTDFVPVNIVQPNLLQALVDSVSNILCSGGTTGGIYITVTGGTAPYSYLWSNGDTTEDISGITAGTYNVAVTDAKGCSTAAGVTINQPLPLFVSIASYQNLNCYNDSSGAIDITVNGGVPPYNFNWTNGSSSEDIYGLHVGSYAVTVTDANGCQNGVSQTLTEPTQLSSSVSVTDVTCAGALNGAVDLSVSGGTPAYSYLWSNGLTSEDLSSVAGGTYTVVITDSKGCNAVNSAVVNEGLPLNISAVVTNTLCNGDTSGAIDVSVSGGATPYIYAWSNGSSNEDLQNISAGNYTLTVTDLNGCSAVASYTITEPGLLTVVLAGHADVSCFGGNNGSIDINVFGGTPLYAYTWNNSATSEDLNGLTLGTYAVTVNDANSCSATFSTIISQPTAIASSISKVDVTCPGAANGSVDLTVSGGVGPYTFVWNNGATTEDLTNITGGTYTVVITDANSCTAANSIVVNEGLPILISGTVTAVLCHGDSSGAIDITVSGGSGSYSYTWSNGANTQDISNLIGGTYAVTATDGNGCSVVATFLITQPATLVLNATTVNVSCAGGSDGSVDITVNGGVFPYNYAWSNGPASEDIHNVIAGTYSVTVTDANGCTITQTYNLNEPNPIISFVVGTNVSCNGAADGTADLTVSGGTSPYTYLWSNFQGSQDVSGLSGGLYYVIITDAHGCTNKDSVIITEPAPLTLSTTITNISCYNSNDGAIDLTVTGGTTPYSYLWSNGAMTQDMNNLQNGVYAVTVTDAHSCTATTSVTIVNPSVITANFIAHDPFCFGSTDGSIDLIPSGGTPGFSFVWSNGATTEDLSGVGAGTYIVTLTDSKGCTRVDSATLVEPQPLVTSGFIRNVSCAGAADGFIDITAYGGTLPYAFLWSAGPSTEDIGNLPGGNYYVTVTDANGCQAATLYPVLEPAPLTTTMAAANVLCAGGKTGNVAVIPAGGTTPYYYLWNTFDTDSSIAGVIAGKYVVQVTDSNGCFTYDSVQITEPLPLNISGTITDALCFGAATGEVDITVAGGTPYYTFVWSNGAVSEDLLGVTADTYTVTVTDQNSCMKAATFVVNQGNEIIVGVGTFNPICHGGNSGSVSAIASGGAGPYTYQWGTTPVQTGLSAGSLVAGTYNLTVADSKACSVTASATLVDPAAIVVTADVTGAKCFNTATGTVNTIVSGGFPPYNYLLNGSAQSTGNFNGLFPGDYIILVSDANGCQGSTDFTVAAPSQISVSLGVTQQVILTGMETQLVATATSDTDIIHYFWNPDSLVDFTGCPQPDNCATPYVFPRTTTTFTVYVMNADSCIASDTLTVTVLNQPSVFIPSAFSPNNDGLNDFFEFDILGATNIEISIFNRWGQRVYYNASQQNGITNSHGWDGNVNGKKAPEDTYVYQMKVTYWDAITKDISGTVTLMK